MMNYYMKLVPISVVLSGLGHVSNANELKETQPQIFSGPGKIYCDKGECVFDVLYDNMCRDACSTINRRQDSGQSCLPTTSGYYNGPCFFSDTSNVIMSNIGPKKDNDRLCYHDKASNINTKVYPSYQADPANPTFDDVPVAISTGCTATCTGCTFWDYFSGPGALECTEGECEAFSRDQCNVKEFIKDPNLEYDILDSKFETLHNIKHINTKAPVEIYQGCDLKCRGCTFVDFVNTHVGAGSLECSGGKVMISDSHCPEVHHVLSSLSSGWNFEDAFYAQDGKKFEWVLSNADLDKIIHKNVQTEEPVKIPEGCVVNSSGCTFVKDITAGSIEEEKSTRSMDGSMIQKSSCARNSLHTVVSSVPVVMFFIYI